jgi:hypothetical protein
VDLNIREIGGIYVSRSYDLVYIGYNNQRIKVLMLLYLVDDLN